MSRTLPLVLLVLALALVSAPLAQSDDWYRDSRTTTAVTQVRPNDESGLLGVGGIDRSRPKIVPVAASYAPEVGSRTFDWADAGIGAGATLGFVLVLAGFGAALVTGRHHRRRRVAST